MCKNEQKKVYVEKEDARSDVEIFESLKDFLPNSKYIFKDDLEKYTSGVVKIHTFWNWFFSGIGKTPETVTMGKKIGYKISDIIEWLKKNTKKEL